MRITCDGQVMYMYETISRLKTHLCGHDGKVYVIIKEQEDKEETR